MTPADDDAGLVDIAHLSVVRHGEALLDDVSMQIKRGGLHAVVGPNGAGKTTLVGAVLGLVACSGRIVLNWSGAGTIGYVPQTFVVDPTLPVTVEDFLALTRQRRPVCLGLSRQTHAAVSRLLHSVSLPGIERRPLAVLSGGELRRVLLAHALDPLPELLILDEPTAGLDEASGHWLEATLTALAKERRTTVLMISHDLDQVRRIADQVTVLDRRIVTAGLPSEVLATSSVRDLLPVLRAGAPRQ